MQDRGAQLGFGHLLDLVLSIPWNLVPNSSRPSWGALGVTPPQISLPAGHTQGDPRSSSLDVVNHLLGKPLTPPRFPPCPFLSAPSSQLLPDWAALGSAALAVPELIFPVFSAFLVG